MRCPHCIKGFVHEDSCINCGHVIYSQAPDNQPPTAREVKHRFRDIEKIFEKPYSRKF